jgi:hypothetical protein
VPTVYARNHPRNADAATIMPSGTVERLGRASLALLSG